MDTAEQYIKSSQQQEKDAGLPGGEDNIESYKAKIQALNAERDKLYQELSTLKRSLGLEEPPAGLDGVPPGEGMESGRADLIKIYADGLETGRRTPEELDQMANEGAFPRDQSFEDGDIGHFLNEFASEFGEDAALRFMASLARQGASVAIHPYDETYEQYKSRNPLLKAILPNFEGTSLEGQEPAAVLADYVNPRRFNLDTTVRVPDTWIDWLRSKISMERRQSEQAFRERLNALDVARRELKEKEYGVLPDGPPPGTEPRLKDYQNKTRAPGSLTWRK